MTDQNTPYGAPDPQQQGSGYQQPGGAPQPGDAPQQPGGAPQPGTPQPGAPQAGGGYGGLGKRFLARFLDGLIVGIPLSIVLGLLPGLRLGGVISSVVIALAGFAYFLFMETSKGATLGKKVLGMAVTDEAGASPISMEKSLRRNWWLLLGVIQGIPVLGLLASLASLVIVILIAVTISSDSRNQGWHDKLGGTLVVDRP